MHAGVDHAYLQLDRHRLVLPLLQQLAQYREMAAFSQFASDLDVATQRLLNRGARLTELLKQGQYQPMPVELQVCVIYAGVHGYLDRIPVNRVSAFEQGLVSEVEANGQDILQSIRQEGTLSAETEGKVKELLDKYTQAFA